MKQKILKVELLLSFFVGSIVCLYLLSKNIEADNVYEISSANDYLGFIPYFIFSKLAQVYYYTGAWVLLPCAIFFVAYKYLLRARNRWVDGLFFIFSTGLFYSVTYIFAPTLLGDGLDKLSTSFISYPLAFLMMFAFLAGLFLTNFRVDWITLAKITYEKSILFCKVSSRFVSRRFNLVKSRFANASGAIKKMDLDIKTNLANKLKSSPEKDEEIQELEDNYFHADILDEEVSDIDQEAVHTEHVIPAIDITQEKKTKRKTPQREKFNTKELIGTISKSSVHSQVQSPDKNYFEEIIKAIEEKLKEFNIEAKIINILKGPVVDTFELELGSGVKVSKVTGLSDDIGLALNGSPIRIVYPMRGKSTIGIEVPRNPREFIFLDEVLNSEMFNDAAQRLPVAMGKDAFGEVKVVDLAAMPHMLVAGATGAGKSVFINTLLVSLIIKKSPQQLKLILIDPKQLELALFADLPHLMLPVLTDPQSSAISLLWAVQEMDRRYSILKELGVKNIEGFNKKVKTCSDDQLFKINQYYEDEQEPGYELPYIVIVIDEFADLILSKAGKEIELNVNRLAAKARAAGIHLVVATQRPSTDVVTGVIKANFPTRVAFRVSTGHDSKTILDQYGAEKLLGKGDMLYKHGVDLFRLHSSFVEETEIEGLIEKLSRMPKAHHPGAVDFLENGGEDPYSESVNSAGSFETGSSSDPMYDRAIEVVMEQGSASASMVQRRLRVGYNRAANLIEEMERNGIIGPAQGSKPREILSRTE